MGFRIYVRYTGCVRNILDCVFIKIQAERHSKAVKHENMYNLTEL